MTLSDIADISQIVGAAAVVVSLVYVGVQLRQAKAAMIMSEGSATQDQFTTFRMAIAGDPDIARIWRTGLTGGPAMSADDEFRLETLVTELIWAIFHLWERSQRGLVEHGELRRAIGDMIVPVLVTARGQALWARIGLGLPAKFVEAMDGLLGQAG